VPHSQHYRVALLGGRLQQIDNKADSNTNESAMNYGGVHEMKAISGYSSRREKKTDNTLDQKQPKHCRVTMA
jgi:hypothetical protein